MTLCFIESQWNMPYENASCMELRNLCTDCTCTSKPVLSGGTPSPLPTEAYPGWTDNIHTHIQIPLTGYVGLILRSTAKATASHNTFKGTMRVLWCYCDRRLQSTLIVPSTVLRLVVATSVLCNMLSFFYLYGKLIKHSLPLPLTFSAKMTLTNRLRCWVFSYSTNPHTDIEVNSAKIRGCAPVSAKIRERAPVYAKIRRRAPVYVKIRERAPVYAKIRRRAPVSAKIRRRAPIYAKIRGRALSMQK